MEIRRLIAEGKITDKGEKQRLKELNKQMRNVSETREEQNDRKRFKKYSQNPKE